MRTRFAPTPSGFLHEGNLANALVTSWLAKDLNGELYLRIDGDDTTRARKEYVEYIHEALRSLNIHPKAFPQPQHDRKEFLRSQLALIPQNLVFACSCSRADLVERACDCRDQGITWEPSMNALRLYLDPAISFFVGEQEINLHSHFGDVVLWRRDDTPAYHWANVIDDRDLGTTHIVRGNDLLSSTALHRYLAELIGANDLVNCTYLHHSLLLDPQGNKISKSAQSNSAAPDLTPEYLDRIHHQAATLAREISVTPRPF